MKHVQEVKRTGTDDVPVEGQRVCFRSSHGFGASSKSEFHSLATSPIQWVTKRDGRVVPFRKKNRGGDLSRDGIDRRR